MEKIATLQELETTWSLSDVLKAHALLEMKADLMNEKTKKLNR